MSAELDIMEIYKNHRNFMFYQFQFYIASIRSDTGLSLTSLFPVTISLTLAFLVFLIACCLRVSAFDPFSWIVFPPHIFTAYSLLSLGHLSNILLGKAREKLPIEICFSHFPPSTCYTLQDFCLCLLLSTLDCDKFHFLSNPGI